MHTKLYTQGLGIPTASQHNLFDLEKLKVFIVLLTGFEPSTFGSPVQRSNHLAISGITDAHAPFPKALYLWSPGLNAGEDTIKN